MTQTDELRMRVTAKKKELEAKLHTIGADASAKAREERAKAKAKLDELQQTMKQGWNDLTEDVAAKLNGWLKDDDEQDVQA